MPLTFFREKPRLFMDIVQSLSTDSTVDVRVSSSKKSTAPPVPSPAIQKAEQGSIYRIPRAELEIFREELWTLRRCDAFDEDEAVLEEPFEWTRPAEEQKRDDAASTSEVTRGATWEDFWRIKDTSPSIFRSTELQQQSSVEHFMVIRRCDAFDEGEEGEI